MTDLSAGKIHKNGLILFGALLNMSLAAMTISVAHEATRVI